MVAGVEGDGATGLDGTGLGAVVPCSIGVVPFILGEPGVVVAGVEGDGAIGLDGTGLGAVVLCSIGEGVEVFSAQLVQVVIVLVTRLVFTMMEVLPLTTVVEVTGQLVTVV